VTLEDGAVLWEEPPAAEDDAGEAPAGLFGAAVAGRYDPVPVFAVEEVDVASGVGPDGGPAGAIVIDGLSVTWGREDVLEQPDLATGSVTLFDPTRRWALETERVGQAVTLRWSGGGLVSYSGAGSTVFFRGRISGCHWAPHTLTYPDGTQVAGALVTMTLTSLLADLANLVPTAAWPAETLGARRTRLAGEASTVLANLVTRAYWQVPDVAPVAAADQVSVWDHLLALYDSSGADRMTYWPPDKMTLHLPRRYLAAQRGVAGLWWEISTAGTPRAGKGVYARSYAIARSEAQSSPQPLYLDAAALEMDPADGMVRGPSSRITRAQVTHPDGAAGYASRTTTHATATPETPATGVRAARLESIITNQSYADLSGADLADFASREGAAWHLGAPVRWSTKLSGGFEDLAQGALLLWGGEVQSSFFLQRSWLPAFGVRPVFGLIGQTIGFRDGGWELDLHLSPLVTSSPQHAITWEEIDNGEAGYEVQWWDDDHPRGMHESLTLDDLGYVSTGLNVPTIPPDTGWDRPA
jgi:hypothetical protein